jgi:hypothetical protein
VFRPIPLSLRVSARTLLIRGWGCSMEFGPRCCTNTITVTITITITTTITITITITTTITITITITI